MNIFKIWNVFWLNKYDCSEKVWKVYECLRFEIWSLKKIEMEDEIFCIKFCEYLLSLY